jgi:tetratricopeptide (TPR) repeat protein
MPETVPESGPAPTRQSGALSASPESSTPAGNVMALQAPPAVPDHQLLRCIGKGSYGEVWLARNVMGTYRAVKIVYRATFDSDRPYNREFEGLKKFEPVSRTHESQVDILHVGRNEAAGYFYHVMELADDQRTGQAIEPEQYEPKTLRSELKTRGRLPVEECLQVALGLTTALEHLHQNGLIHRDIKPSNIIFVNGIPKLADIGLVATVDATCSFVGTEGYLPPEGPGTAQADLYSLGKVLYEMSTGKDRRDFPELPTGLVSADDEKGILELNAVVVKACKPDARQRYQSAGQMHQDLLLLVAGKSVRRTHVLERRLKLMTRAGVVAATVVVLGAFPYYVALKEKRLAKSAAARADRLATDEASARRLAQQREKQALQSAEDAKAVLAFVCNKVLAAPRPAGEPGAMSRNVTVREALTSAEASITPTFPNQPAVEASVRGALGETEIYLGNWTNAVTQLERALELFKKAAGPNATETLGAMNNLALAYEGAGRLSDATRLQEESLRGLEATLGPNDQRTLIAMHGLVLTYVHLERLDLAIPLGEKTFRLRKATLGPNHTETLSSMDVLAVSLLNAGRYTEAISLFEEALRRVRSQSGSPSELAIMGNLANAYQRAGCLTEALPLREEVFKQRTEKYGPEAPVTLTSLNNLASLYEAFGRAEALPLYEQILQRRLNKLGPAHQETLVSIHNLAGLYRHLHRTNEAISLFQQAVIGWKAKLGPDSPSTLFSIDGLAMCYLDTGQGSNAVDLLEPVLASAGAKMDPAHPAIMLCRSDLASAYLLADRPADAEPLARQCLEVREKRAPNAWLTLDSRARLGAVLLARQRYADAEQLLLPACRELRARADYLPADGRQRLQCDVETLVKLYRVTGRPDQAAEWSRIVDKTKPGQIDKVVE